MHIKKKKILNPQTHQETPIYEPVAILVINLCLCVRYYSFKSFTACQLSLLVRILHSNSFYVCMSYKNNHSSEDIK